GFEPIFGAESPPFASAISCAASTTERGVNKAMTQGGKEQRRRERVRLELPTRVVVREGPQEEWMEVTRVMNLTPFGARFSLARPVDRGRLVHLTLPMPRQLRCFNHVEDQYRV